MKRVSFTIQINWEIQGVKCEGLNLKTLPVDRFGSPELSVVDKPIDKNEQTEVITEQPSPASVEEITPVESFSPAYVATGEEICQTVRCIVDDQPEFADELLHNIRLQLPEYLYMGINESCSDDILDFINRLTNVSTEIRNAMMGVIMTLDPEPYDGGVAFNKYFASAEGSWLR